MKRVTTLVVLVLFVFSNSFSQGLFKTKNYNSLEEDADYITNQKDFDVLDKDYNALVGKVKALYDYEQKAVTDFFTQIRTGQTTLLNQTLKDTVIVAFVQRNELDPKEILDLSSNVHQAMMDSEGLQVMYEYKTLLDAKNSEKVFPFSGNLGFELEFYDFQDKDRVLVMDAHDISFGKEIGFAAKNTRVYYQNTKLPTLKTISYALSKDKEIEKVTDKRGTRFYVVQGNNETTGIENIKFSKIFFRHGLKGYEDTKSMFASLSKSITSRSTVYIRTLFSDECLGSTCDQLLSSDDYKEIIIDLGLVEIEYKKDIHEGNVYHFFKYGTNSNRQSTRKRR